jgi:hypothetical protein
MGSWQNQVPITAKKNIGMPKPVIFYEKGD